MPSLTDSLFERLSAIPLVGVLRGCPVEHVVAIATTAVDSGIGVVEITLDSPEAVNQIALISKRLPGTVGGAGTVRSAEQVDVAVQAGARFIVAPGTKLSVVSRSVALNVPCIPGAATPSEIEYAFDLGATAVKVFPADQLGGPPYLKALQAPLRGIPLLPTGGIDASNAADYLDSGAIAVGVGALVFPASALATGNCSTIADAIMKLVEAIK